MKNNMIIGALLFVVSLSNSVAQTGAEVNKSVSRSFEKNFAGASHLNWTACGKDISLAQFRFEDKPWVAYFDESGTLITSGRKLSVHELPSKVNDRMHAFKSKAEKKYGAFTIGSIYEMATDRLIEYYVYLSNDKISLMIAVESNGVVSIKRKAKKSYDGAKPVKDVLASQK